MITRFDTRNAKADKALAINALRDQIAKSPIPATRFKRFGVYNPHPDQYKLAWADPEKLEEKIARGAQVVSRKDAKELYRIPDRELTSEGAKRARCVLIRYPIIAWEAHRASLALEALALMSDPQASLAQQMLNAGIPGVDERSIAMMDDDGRRIKARGQGRNYVGGFYRRPESATLEDALDRQRQREAAITEVLSESELARLADANRTHGVLSPEEEEELQQAVGNPAEDSSLQALATEVEVSEPAQEKPQQAPPAKFSNKRGVPPLAKSEEVETSG